MRRLSPQEIDELTGLLLRAVDFAQLRRFFRLATDEELEKLVSPTLPLREAVYQLLQTLEQAPITDQFLDIVYREKPFQFELRAFIASLYPEIATNESFARRAYTIQVRGQGIAKPMPDLLQRIVVPGNQFFDLRVWLDKLSALERQVCCIEAKDQALGTGFLVGPQAVLTNWHVVDEARKIGAADNEIGCRFDFRRLTNGRVDRGSRVDVSAVLAESPCSQAELGPNPNTPAPRATELDYAVLQLVTPQTDRGYINIASQAAIRQNDSLVIVQHPDGQELRFAVDTQAISGLHHDGLRVRYTTNTDPGSSGSPCLTMKLDIVALHHLGDPRRGPAQYNQGIPVGLIHQAIAQTPAAALLGA